METKKCKKCGEEKELTFFRVRKDNKTGYGNICKVCESITTKKYYEINKDKIIEYREINKEKTKEYFKIRYENNKDKILLYHKEYYEKNKNQKLEYDKEYRNKNKETIKTRKQEWYIKNKNSVLKRINNNYKIRKETDFLFKLKIAIKNNIYHAIKRNNHTKKSKTQDILGCSYEDFKQYIENLWEPWMNWDNYGKYNGELNFGWDIDHIIPISSAKCEDEIIKLNNFNNLQPLCSYINRNIKRGN